MQKRRIAEKMAWMIFMTAIAFLLSRQLRGETPQLADINEGTAVYRKMALSMKLRWAVMSSSRLWI